MRSRWMPGILARAGQPVTLTVGDLDALVSIRVESAATAAASVDLVDQPGSPTFDAPADPGDYLVGIDLTGRARTLSYVLFVRLTADAPSVGGTAMTFPVNVTPQAVPPVVTSPATAVPAPSVSTSDAVVPTTAGG